MDVHENLDPAMHAQAVELLMDGSLEVESVGGVADTLGAVPMTALARVPGFEDKAIYDATIAAGEPLDVDVAWTLLGDPDRGGGYVFMDMRWPAIDEFRRVHVDLATTTRRMLDITETIRPGWLGLTGVPRGTVPDLDRILWVNFPRDDEAFQVCLSVARELELEGVKGRGDAA